VGTASLCPPYILSWPVKSALAFVRKPEIARGDAKSRAMSAASHSDEFAELHHIARSAIASAACAFCPTSSTDTPDCAQLTEGCGKGEKIGGR